MTTSLVGVEQVDVPAGATRTFPLAGPLAGKAAEVTVERPVPSKPEHAEAVSIETRTGTDTLENKFDTAALPVVQAQAPARPRRSKYLQAR